MLQQVNKAEEILQRLSQNGQSKVLNQPGDVTADENMNKIMEETQRDFQVMDKQSQISASKVILTS